MPYCQVYSDLMVTFPTQRSALCVTSEANFWFSFFDFRMFVGRRQTIQGKWSAVWGRWKKRVSISWGLPKCLQGHKCTLFLLQHKFVALSVQERQITRCHREWQNALEWRNLMRHKSNKLHNMQHSVYHWRYFVSGFVSFANRCKLHRCRSRTQRPSSLL